jgi:hypothetical protein
MTAEEIAEEAKDAKFLKEKCPTCTEQFKWHYEQVGEAKKSE